MQQPIDYQDAYLRLLAQKFCTVQEVSTEIINLEAILALPKGTEHFMSDIHGEDEAFAHILNNCSGVIRDKIDAVYGESLSAAERAELATLIYYPTHKLEYIKSHMTGDLGDWYRTTLRRLVEIGRAVASKYTRSKVRKALPQDFAYIIDELLNADAAMKNREDYYDRIITSLIGIDRADAFITAIAGVIKQLAVDRLHIIGDVFDRGPRPDKILDMLMRHHSVDIQWGNHDMLWMGAACGSEACIFDILGISVKYSNMEMLERGYGISLRHLTNFAQKTYADGGCFAPKVISAMDREISGTDSIARLYKAVLVIQSILPVSARQDAKGSYVNNQRIIAYNQVLRELAEQYGAVYLNVGEAVADENGYLRADWNFDGVHLNVAGCQAWLEYLRTHPVTEVAPEDLPAE